MITWTSRGFIAALALAFLSACEGMPAGTGALAAKPKPQALARATLGKGAVTLVPPPGYCLDRSSIGDGFALMARCDALGAPLGTAGGAPVGFITVSLMRDQGKGTLPRAVQTARALGLTGISQETEQAGILTYRAEGPPPAPSIASSHWRATGRVGNYLISVAVYGPANSRTITGEGRGIARMVIERTRAAS